MSKRQNIQVNFIDENNVEHHTHTYTIVATKIRNKNVQENGITTTK